ncbi:MAG: DUF4468 domain-containing protein [Alloprevotella sp.]|nr:DUF4468 domain-containing protein [Alloprevotella sp.]
MKLKATLLLMLALPAIAMAQDWNNKKYLAGAVPQQQGVVIFSRTYEVPGKSRAEIFSLLREYTERQILNGENSLPQCRLVECDEVEGLLAARVEEYLYFKRSALVSHRTRMSYELVYDVRDGGFTVDMRRIRYRYEEQETPNGMEQNFTAEEWISDAEALTKKGTLLRKTRKFRVFTIDRKDEIFREAARAAGATVKTRLVEVDD